MPTTAGSVGEQSIPPPLPMVLDFSEGAIACDHASAAPYHVHDRPATISRTRTHARQPRRLNDEQSSYNGEGHTRQFCNSSTIIYGGSTWATSAWAGSSYAA